MARISMGVNDKHTLAKKNKDESVNRSIDKVNAAVRGIETRLDTELPELTYLDEPTVISDVSVREDIPKINAKADKLTETGQFYDTLGNLRNADGSVADEDPRESEISMLENDASEIDDQIASTLDSLFKQTDADTARQIGAIKAQYDVHEQQLRELNRRNEKATDTTLLLGGSSRYTTSSEGISSAQVRHGIMELAQLDAQEQAAIAKVKQAQSDQNYKIAEKAIAQLEKMREEKIEKASTLAEAIAEENNKLREKSIQMSREMAIADLFQQGITDPVDMLDFLNRTEDGEIVGDITLSEIEDVLKIINPSEELSGLTADYKTYRALQDKGEIPESWNYFDFQAASANAKRKPVSGDGSSVESEILSFDEWKQSDDAQQMLDQEIKRQVEETGTGGFTTATADTFLRSIYDESVKDYKRSSADREKNYTSSNIPNKIKADLIVDITQNNATLQEIYTAYPDVSSSYLSSLYNSLDKKESDAEESEMSDEEFMEVLNAG